MNIASHLAIATRRARGDRTFSQALDDVRRGSRDPAALATLVERWGNPFSADAEFLGEVIAQAENQDGLIVETGSGLTTVVLAAVAPHRALSLEGSRYWLAQAKVELARHKLQRSIRLKYSPVVAREGMTWYADRLPDVGPWHKASLIVCDGPPGHRGGRGALMPAMSSLMTPETVILFDDADRPAEQRMLAHWRDEYGASIVLSGSNQQYAVITGASAAGHSRVEEP